MARARKSGPTPKQQQRRCVTKRSYDNQAAADAAIESQARERGFYAPDWSSYRCRHCARWHIGHRPGLGRERGI